MNKTLNKILISSASLLMLAGVGASASQVSNSVHASRISRLYARRSRDYHDIKLINAQLSKLEHKNIRKNHKVKNTRRHESSATWYYHNFHKLNRYYGNRYRGYREGRLDGNDYPFNDSDLHNPDGYDGDGVAVMQTKNIHLKYYKQGWIVANATSNNDGTNKDFRNSIKNYNNGVAYAKSNPTAANIYLGNSGIWFSQRGNQNDVLGN